MNKLLLAICPEYFLSQNDEEKIQQARKAVGNLVKKLQKLGFSGTIDLSKMEQ